MISVNKTVFNFSISQKNNHNLARVLNKYSENINDKTPVIRVIGTNGKGSVSYFIQKGLQAKYNKVGLFTSPAFLYHNERISINNEMIDDIHLIDLINSFKDIAIANELNFFEIWTYIGIKYFAINDPVDIAVIEAGIGGKYDSTRNFQNEVLTVLTTVDLDHTEILGNTVEEILLDKLEIINHGSTLIVSHDNLKYKEFITIEMSKKNVQVIFADLIDDPVKYQQANRGLATKVLEFLKINNYQLPENGPLGRFTKLTINEQEYILDGAHNVNGIDGLIQSVEQQNINPIVIFASSVNKNHNEMLAKLSSHFSQVYITEFDHPKAWNLSEKEFANPTINWKEFLLQKHNSNMVILICGSLYFIPLVYEFLEGLKSL